MCHNPGYQRDQKEGMRALGYPHILEELGSWTTPKNAGRVHAFSPLDTDTVPKHGHCPYYYFQAVFLFLPISKWGTGYVKKGTVVRL